jgi:hypothetical protein
MKLFLILRVCCGLCLLSSCLASGAVLGVDAYSVGGVATAPGVLDPSIRTWTPWSSAINVNGQSISLFKSVSDANAGGVGTDPLLSNYLLVTGGVTGTLTFSNLLIHQTYTFVFFSQQQAFGQGGTFGRGGRWTVTSSSPNLTANSSGDTPAGTGYQQNGNYVRFNNLSPTSTGTITVTFFSLEGAAFFNGFEIETVPEPSVAFLITLSCCVLLRRKRVM